MNPLRAGRRVRGAVRALLLTGIALLAPSCGDDTPTEPTALDVRATYVSRIVGCPDKGNECYPMCVHGATPAGVRIVPLWQADAIHLSTTATTDRYEGTLAAVPTNTTLRLYGTDPNACCINSCSPPPVVEEILLNGMKLTKVVHDNLPSGVTAALEFTLKGDGTIQN
jgi:hypothetical protein